MLYLQRIQIVCHDCKTFLRHFALIESKKKREKKRKSGLEIVFDRISRNRIESDSQFYRKGLLNYFLWSLLL